MGLSGWEPLDTGGRVYWGVCLKEDYSCTPDAIFLSKDDAEAWLADYERRYTEDPDNVSPPCDPVILGMQINGQFWNSIQQIPKS